MNDLLGEILIAIKGPGESLTPEAEDAISEAAAAAEDLVRRMLAEYGWDIHEVL